jgi:hypothetical protein
LRNIQFKMGKTAKDVLVLQSAMSVRNYTGVTI